MAVKNANTKKANKPNRAGVGKPRPFVTPLPPAKRELPLLAFPTAAFQPPPTSMRQLRKWCITNKVPALTSNNPAPAFELNQADIVVVRQQNIRVPGSEATWAEVLYHGKPGWVNEVFLDDYVEDFPADEVPIPNATPQKTDAAQYMTRHNMVTYNMCGELCVAYIIKHEIDPHTDIDKVLDTWEKSDSKSPFRYSEKTIREGTTSSHLRNMLETYGYTNLGAIQDLSTSITAHKPLSPENLKFMLETHYLLARVKSQFGTSGALAPIDQGSGRDERNHWIVVDKITHNGNRVQVYNPYHNKRETYSYNEFFYACTAPKLSGLWVIRKNKQAPTSLNLQLGLGRQKEVSLDSMPAPGAEQYLMIGGQKKTQLCGEFSVAYILGKSLDRALLHWKQNEDAAIKDLLTVLKAYGCHKTDVSPAKSFTIETVLSHWNAVQPKLYEYHVGQNKPTPTTALTSILRAYGYNPPSSGNPGDYLGFSMGLTTPSTSSSKGLYLPSPGRMKNMLKTHFLIAGVGINGVTGRLIRGLNAVRHWVVVEKIEPVGRHYLTNHFGGNGGWVTLYNPFTNVLEEYSYREFTDSMSETGLWDGLWVKRDVQPHFGLQTVLYPVIETKKGKQPAKPAQVPAKKRWPEKRVLEEIAKRIKNGQPRDKIPALLFAAGSGWSREEISRRMPGPKVPAALPDDALKLTICEHMKIVDIAPELVTLLRQESHGDTAAAKALADTLCDMGIMVIGPNKKAMVRSFPVLPQLRRSAIEKFVAGFSRPQQLAVPARSAVKVANAIQPMFASRILTRLDEIRAAEPKKKQ